MRSTADGWFHNGPCLLIQYQAGYEAASKYISIVKEMLDTLLMM